MYCPGISMQTEQVEELALCGDTQEHVARTLGIYSLRRMSISERSPLALFLALGELLCRLLS